MYKVDISSSPQLYTYPLIGRRASFIFRYDNLNTIHKKTNPIPILYTYNL